MISAIVKEYLPKDFFRRSLYDIDRNLLLLMTPRPRRSSEERYIKMYSMISLGNGNSKDAVRSKLDNSPLTK